MRLLIQMEKNLAVFVVESSSSIYSRIANQLGMGTTTFLEAIREVTRAL